MAKGYKMRRGGSSEVSIEEYTGAYEITPTTAEQTLLTKDKYMSDDVTVKEIPFFEVSNTSGGSTVYIADSIE